MLLWCHPQLLLPLLFLPLLRTAAAVVDLRLAVVIDGTVDDAARVVAIAVMSGIIVRVAAAIAIVIVVFSIGLRPCVAFAICVLT